MVYVFCGLPAPYATFIVRLGLDILREFYGDFQYVAANTLDQLREGLEKRGDRPIMIYFDVPDIKIAQSVVHNGIPTVLVTEPVEQAILYAMKARSLSALAASRFVTQSAASLFPVVSANTISPLRIGTQLNELESLVNRVSFSLGLSLTSVNVDNILALYDQANRNHLRPLTEIIYERVEHASEAATGTSELTPEEVEVVQATAAAYDMLMSGQIPSRIKWPVAACFSGQRPTGGLAGPIEMVGPARMLSWGPYFHLPAGEWLADVTFSVKGNYSGNIIVIDVLADGKVTVVAKSVLPKNGTFSAQLEFEVSAPNQPVEVRVVMAEGAIEGEFELVSLTIERVAS
ncbi:hypothetical protein [Ensifer adhaerens]|uniref:hypothetical protein n=1 Tax=Ensifer adhaerens TaxID=106592 RepID=UPI000CF11071|nr:hypothetical protein [Ensifer adhaerens]